MEIYREEYSKQVEDGTLIYLLFRFLRGFYSNFRYTNAKDYSDCKSKKLSEYNKIILLPNKFTISTKLKSSLLGISDTAFKNNLRWEVYNDIKDLLDYENQEEVSSFYKSGSSRLDIAELSHFKKQPKEVFIHPVNFGHLTSSDYNHSLHIYINVVQLSKLAGLAKIKREKFLEELINRSIIYALIQLNIFATTSRYEIDWHLIDASANLDSQQIIIQNVIDSFNLNRYFPNISKVLSNMADFTACSHFLQDYLNIKSLTQIDKNTVPLYLENGKIFSYGLAVSDRFSDFEQKFLETLLCAKDIASYVTIAEGLWNLRSVEKFSLWAIQKLVQNLRQKFLLLNIPQDLIINVRGKGYKISKNW